ncbi:sulfatase [Candidatus Binatia bacterium]|nr:sulfatase [Candidatus Binatia bacterium]
MRFADAPTPATTSAALEPGGYVLVDEVSRPVLNAPRVFRQAPECAPAARLGPGPCTVAVPAAAAAAPAVVVEITRYAARGETDGRVERMLVATPHDGRVALPAGLHRHAIRRIELRGVPALEEADRTTAPFVVPPGALLRFAIALDPATREVTEQPVTFEVAAVDADGERRVFQRVLDPAAHDVHGWSEVEVPLDDLQGRTTALRFRARAAAAPAAFPLWGDPTLWAPLRADDRPTIVLVSLDTLRARSTSTYGNERETSPYLTRLAADGVLFEHAYTTFSNTLGAHMSMMTGLYPASHGVVGLDRTLAREHRTLAEALRGAGYDTAAFTEDGLLEGAIGFQRGFSRYGENRGVFAAAGDAPGTFARALAWARTRGGQPFFLFVHTYAVHLPYEPPTAYRSLFTDQGEPIPTAGLEYQRLRYEQEIRALDDELRTLVAGLVAVVPRDRLVLIVTADHGEEFGEHGQMTHLQLYDEVMHVPLLVLLPEGRAGARVTAPVSLVDLMPTVLTLAHVDAPPGEGVALDRVLRGTEDDAPARSALYGLSLPYDLTGKQWRFIARTADGKCMLDEQGDGDCFDLTADPGEHAPLPATAHPALAMLHDAAAAYRERARPVIAAGPGRADAPSTDPGTVDESLRRKLRALGYAH